MKILFFGDSVTEMGRDYSGVGVKRFGVGYPLLVAAELYKKDITKYEVINKGISGNRVVDLYARIKADVWNQAPDVISIMIGVNDLWHEIEQMHNGVDIVRFEKVYRMVIDDTLERFPKMKFILCEPCYLHGVNTDEKYDQFEVLHDYANVAKKLAKEYGFPFVSLQKKLSEAAEKYGAGRYLIDGIHPDVAGAKLIADEWIKVFESQKWD